MATSFTPPLTSSRSSSLRRRPSRVRRLPAILACLVALPAFGFLAAAAPTATAAPQANARPRLLVVIVLDQFRADNLTRFAPWFSDGGFKRLMREGAVFTDAQYTHATTYTGPGHATISSGSYAHVNGIVGNRWFNPATQRVESVLYDPKADLFGVKAVPKDDDTSPRNFIGDTLGDELRLSNHLQSKVVSVSLKDRAAILLAGKLGKAYWYHEGAGGFISSAYYGDRLPAWVTAFNARKLPDAAFGKRWEKLLPEAAYSISRQDDFPQENDFQGLGRTFPHTLTDKSGKPTAAFYEGFTATPFSTDYELEFARRAIEEEGLGQDDAPDLLGVSITAPDIAGHAFGPYSQETQDLVVHTDRQLADFFTYLDRRFGRNRTLIALTSDHGATPIPEYMQSLGVDAGRIKKKQLSDALGAALTARYGAADWITTLEDPSVFLNRAVIAEKRLDPAEVERVAGEAALTVPGILRYFTRTQLTSGSLGPSVWAAKYEKAFLAERCGDLLLMTKPFYFWGSYGEKDAGSTHGSPWGYDSHVPLLLSGPGVQRGTHNGFVDMADLAPTLAHLMGVSAPAGSEGRVLPVDY